MIMRTAVGSIWILLLAFLTWQMINTSRLVVSLSSLTQPLPLTHLQEQAKEAKEAKAQQSQQLRHPIFYNLYIPPNGDQAVHSIVAEQIAQVQRIAGDAAPVLVTLIALAQDYKNFTINAQQQQQQLCPSCHLRQYLEQGDEMDTLQALWQYCQTTEYPADQEFVTYIHDKGSLHNTKTNRAARKISTRGALQCRRLFLLVSEGNKSSPLTKDCNACGDTFTLVPQFHATAK